MDKSLSNMTKIGWKATAGSLDKNELISELQSALSDEIEDLKKPNLERDRELFDGRRTSAQGGLFVYTFQSGDLSTWRRRRRRTQLKLTIDSAASYGFLDSCSKDGVRIALETNLGEFVEKVTVEDSSFELLQSLHDKLEKVKKGQSEFNAEGAMKLFGLIKPNSFPRPVLSSEQKTSSFNPNVEQQLAIRRSMSQEVTFIWGPPGTGKTRTLSWILNILIQAKKSVLLTANTNRAVDEILKKFVDDPANRPLVEEGRIVRLGIPDDEDESLNCILFETIAEKRTVAIQKNISELQAQIESSQNALRKYEEIERSSVKRIVQKEHQIQEREKVEAEIIALQSRITRAQANVEREETLLSDKRQSLEKAKNVGKIKRFLSGLDTGRIQAEIASIENGREMARLELHSLQKQLSDQVQEKNTISGAINQYRNEIEPPVDGLTTLESLRQRTIDLREEADSKRKLMIQLQSHIGKIKEDVFNEALVIGSTIARATLDPKICKRKFDTLVVDEASMASLPDVFFLAGLCSSHYIVSGDFRQLPPIARCKSVTCLRWLKRDIFTQAGIVEAVDTGIDDDRLVMLREQYRMHPDICALVSDAVYERKLKTPGDISSLKEKLAEIPPFEGRALVFCDTATTNPLITRPENTFSRLSPYSAAISSKIAVQCIREGEKNGFQLNVGIVTPYREQAKLISKMLEDEGIEPTRIVASTVHRFQGSEKDCVIFDLVEGKPLRPGRLTEGTFKNSEAGKLITVAISRAMEKFILVGNSEYIKSRFLNTDAVHQLMQGIILKGEEIDSCEVERTFNDENKANRIQQINDASFTMFDDSSFYNAFIEDLKKAKSRIVIFSPFVSRKRVMDLLPIFKEILRKKVPIYVITRNPEYRTEYKTETIESLHDLSAIGVTVIPAYKELGMDDRFEKFHYKVALIDNSVVYYGSLNILSQVDSSESMMAFRSRKTVAQLARIFHVSDIVKGPRFEDLKSNLPVANKTEPDIMADKSEEQVRHSNKLLDYSTKLETSDSTAFSKLFGAVEPGKDVRQHAEDRIWKMGKDLGFTSFTWYEAPNLLNDGRNRFISVIWKKGMEIAVAFQVRRKKHDIGIVTSLRDIRKLQNLQANEKYIVNVSETTGKAYFHRVTDWDNKDINEASQRFSSNTEDHKKYNLDEIRLKNARAYEIWTEEEDKELISDYHNNLSVSAIAEKHKRQRSAIRSRLKKLEKRGLI